MSFKKYLILMTFSTFVCWIIWLLVLNYIDPQEAGFLGFIFFYFSLFLSLVGTISIVGLFIRMKILKDELVFRHVSTAFRQAILFSILIIGALFLNSKSLLTWWDMVLFILALSVIEFFFIAYKANR